MAHAWCMLTGLRLSKARSTYALEKLPPQHAPPGVTLPLLPRAPQHSTTLTPQPGTAALMGGCRRRRQSRRDSARDASMAIEIPAVGIGLTRARHPG